MPEKSGFEIRTDLLHLAHVVLESNARMKYEASEERYKDGDDLIVKRKYEGYTVDDIVNVATKLNEFVSRTTTRSA